MITNMKTLYFFLLLLLVLTVFAACSGKKKPQAGYTMVKLDQVFELKMNESVMVENQDLKLSFSAVPEDSRCPEGVNCFQEGQVRITLAAANAGRSQLLEFSRTPSQKGNTTKTVGEFKIQLNEVSPYPKNDVKIKPEEYRLKLAVRKVAG